MARDRFVNPANGNTYNFHINHRDEESSGRTRTITRTANTGLVGAVRQQGDDGPLILKWSGKIEHRAQFVAMWQWFQLCRYQTIHLYDFDNQGYEVQIIDFQPKRAPKLSMSGKDRSVPYHYWEYTLEMEVYTILSGDLATAGVTP